MISKAVLKAAAFLAACILIISPCDWAVAGSENRALGLKIHEQAGLIRCVIKFQNHPAYSVRPTHANKIMIVFSDAAKSDDFLKSVSEAGQVVSVAGEILSPSLGLIFSLPAPLQELSIARLMEDDSAGIYLELSHGGNTLQNANSESSEAMLQKVNVGFTNMCTRLVLDLNRRTPWNITQSRLNGINIRLRSIPADLDKKHYGPANNLAMASLSSDNAHTDIAVRMLTQIDRIRVFWLKNTSLLVTDIFEGPPYIEEEAPILSASLDKQILPLVKDTEPLQEGPKPVTQEIVTEIDSPEVEAEDLRPVFRGRINKDDQLSGTSNQPQDQGSVDTAERDEIPEEKILEELEPEEALIFGQIRHSYERKNYVQAIKQCDQFLQTFPGSPMAEKVSFLKGDAEFELVKAGDNKHFSSMIRTYQSTISRFRRSPYIQKAYLKMAQASSLVGNDYAAIGYLNIVLHGAKDENILIEGLIERGRVYFKVNRHDKALEDFKTILDQYPDTPRASEAEMGTARYFLEVGLNEKAEETISKLLKEHPDFHLKHPEILFYRGKNAMYQKQYDKAREYFFRGLNIGGQPESTDLLLARIGDTYHHSSRPREAENYYRAVIREHSDSEGASIAKLRLAGYQSGYSGFQDIHEENPDKPVADLAMLEMARKYYEENQFLKAMETLKTLIDRPFKSEIVLEAKRLYYRTARTRN